MNCLKCGRETPAEQVFCEKCRLEMEKYPVKPGTVVLLPRRTDHGPSKKVSRRRTIAPEEQVRILRKWVRGLLIGLVLSILLCAVLAYPAYRYLMEDHFKIGQNYSVVTTPTTVPAETAMD